jgi:hypothetical protein
MRFLVLSAAGFWFLRFVVTDIGAQTTNIDMFSFSQPRLRSPVAIQTNKFESVTANESPMTFKDGVWYYAFYSDGHASRTYFQNMLDITGNDPSRVGDVNIFGEKFEMTRGPVIVDMGSPMANKADIEIARIQAERFETKRTILGCPIFISQNEIIGAHLGDKNGHDPALSFSPKGASGVSLKFICNF